MWCYCCRHPATHEILYVEAFHLPAFPGARDRWGAPLEPDSPEELVIHRVTTEAGADLPQEAVAGLETHLVAEGFRARRMGLLL